MPTTAKVTFNSLFGIPASITITAPNGTVAFNSLFGIPTMGINAAVMFLAFQLPFRDSIADELRDLVWGAFNSLFGILIDVVRYFYFIDLLSTPFSGFSWSS